MPTELPPADEKAASVEASAGTSAGTENKEKASEAKPAAAKASEAKPAAAKANGKTNEKSLGAALRKRWRGWLRAVHRDMGYLAVGLTFIYALSGLAINHLQDWDPNFTSFSREKTIPPIGADVPDEEAFARVRAALALPVPRDTYRAGDEIHLTYDGREVVVYGDSGQVTDQGQKPRFFLRVANWLHYNRGKKAWTYIADAYAVLLLYLAVSGMFMIKGKLGLKWRGTALVGLGAAVPLAYVVLSGGPSANAKKTADASAVSAPAVEGKKEADGDGDGERMRPRPVPGEKASGEGGDDGGGGGGEERMKPRPVPGEKANGESGDGGGGGGEERMKPRPVPGEK